MLIVTAMALPLTVDPEWAYYDKEEGIAYSGKNTYWHKLRGEFFYYVFKDLRNDLIRGRMTMWMNELFVSNTNTNMPYMFQQYLTRQKYALGNFRDFIYDMGLDATMIKYLSNFSNKAGRPNENYARELYELFTLGVDNGYTETDIQETARAFTGYNTTATENGLIVFNVNARPIIKIPESNLINLSDEFGMPTHMNALEAMWGDKVLTMTQSEFGRRVAENGSRGTDHGSSGPIMLFGEAALQGSGFIGKYASVEESQLVRGDLQYHTDFREVYGAILKEWMCAL